MRGTLVALVGHGDQARALQPGQAIRPVRSSLHFRFRSTIGNLRLQAHPGAADVCGMVMQCNSGLERGVSASQEVAILDGSLQDLFSDRDRSSELGEP